MSSASQERRQQDSFGESRLNSALQHERMASLSQEALALYVALAREANGSGHVSSQDAWKITASDEAIRELVAADLVDVEPGGSGIWIVHPDTLDAAEEFASGRVS